MLLLALRKDGCVPAKCCCLARQIFLAEDAGSGDAVDEFKAHLPAVEAVELAVDVIKKFFDVLYGRSCSASRASSGSSFLVLFFGTCARRLY